MILFYGVRQTHKVRDMNSPKRTEPTVTKTFRVPVDLYQRIEAEIGPNGDFSEFARQALKEAIAARASAEVSKRPPSEDLKR